MTDDPPARLLPRGLAVRLVCSEWLVIGVWQAPSRADRSSCRRHCNRAGPRTRHGLRPHGNAGVTSAARAGGRRRVQQHLHRLHT